MAVYIAYTQYIHGGQRVKRRWHGRRYCSTCRYPLRQWLAPDPRPAMQFDVIDGLARPCAYQGG